ncbi:MAG TPA: DinB family protein [Gemmatimonadaceae bacterium]
MAKADSTPLTTLFPDLEPELATTRRMLERVPNGKDDWRPHPKSRSLGELATHLAQLPGFALMMLTRDEFDAFASRPPDPTFASAAERVQLFDQLSAQLKGLLQQMTWDQANQSWILRAGGAVALQAPRSTAVRTAFLTHSAHHRAQIGVYLRMLDVPVPWTYGGSADEMPGGAM